MKNQRYGVLFDTSKDSHYYYDAGTGKVISCNKDERALISRILSNEISVKTACELNDDFFDFVRSENLFSDKFWTFSVPDKEEFIELVSGNCEQIVIELTEVCNLRCGYCIYNDHHPNHRGFSNKSMTFDIAKKSIDYLLKNFKRNEFALTFYGGEPLANFSLMHQCIEYVRHHYKSIKLSYGFTTNLTLLTKEMVDYFKTIENMDIVCSLDGPKELHDRYRRYINGNGTFEVAIHNFKLLLNEFYCPEKKRGLSINCVLTPPYQNEKLKKIRNFFYEELAVPKTITCNYSYVDGGEMQIEDSSQDGNSVLEASPLEEWAANDFASNKEESDFWGIINVELLRVANRLISNEGIIEQGYLHGNCIPGQRRIYVTTDGDFKPCEKVGRAPTLGNYIDGYNFDRTYRLYIEEYIQYFHKKCSNCWARNMCGVCYESSMDGEGNCPYVAGGLCDTSRSLVKDMFVNYYRLYEKDRDGLEKALSTVELK